MAEGSLESFGVTAGTIVTMDDEIAKIEQLIDAGKIEHMVNLVLEPVSPGIFKIHTMTLETPLPRVREMLKVALQSVEDMIGKD